MLTLAPLAWQERRAVTAAKASAVSEEERERRAMDRRGVEELAASVRRLRELGRALEGTVPDPEMARRRADDCRAREQTQKAKRKSVRDAWRSRASASAHPPSVAARDVWLR